MTTSVFAVWWNPFTWFQKKNISVSQIQSVPSVEIDSNSKIEQVFVATPSDNKDDSRKNEDKKISSSEDYSDERISQFFNDCKPFLFEDKQALNYVKILGKENNLCKIDYMVSGVETKKGSGAKITTTCSFDLLSGDGIFKKTAFSFTHSAIFTDNISISGVADETTFKNFLGDNVKECKHTFQKLSKDELELIKNKPQSRSVEPLSFERIHAILLVEGFDLLGKKEKEERVAKLVCLVKVPLTGKETVINGISVPTEPDQILNNKTLAGVDSNKNGVRDDLERLIAKNFGCNTKKYSEAFNFAKLEQAVVVAQSKESIEKYIQAVECGTMSADELDIGTYAVINTSERRGNYGMALAGVELGKCEIKK